MKGREEEHAVIAPPEAPIELGDRHHFERRDPERREMRQPFTRRRPRPAGGERADVHFVDDLAVTRLRASPATRRPCETRADRQPSTARRDRPAESVNGIGAKSLLETEPVTLTRSYVRCRRTEIAGSRWRHRNVWSSVQHERDLSLRRRPHGESDAVGIDGGAERRLGNRRGLTSVETRDSSSDC